MKFPSRSIVLLVLLVFCMGSCFGWWVSSGHQSPTPIAAPLPAPIPTPSVIVDKSSSSPTAASPVLTLPTQDWGDAEYEICQYTGDVREFDAFLASKVAAFPGNPTAKVALLFAAAEWADRVGDTSASVRKKATVGEFQQYWKRGVLWQIESLQYEADLYSQTDRTDKSEMEEHCMKKMKRTCEEHELTFRVGRDENTKLLTKYYKAALDRLGQDGRKLDVLWAKDANYDTSERRIFMRKENLFLSEMLRSPPEDSSFNRFAADASLSAEERTKIDDVRKILIRLLDKDADMNASVQNEDTSRFHFQHFLESTNNKGNPVRVLTEEEFDNLPPYDPKKANKEYRDLTADPPLPKPGEKAPPKPPEEKLVPYLKDPTNKDPKANGLGLSLETLTDVVRADLGPPPFPLPLRLTGLEGARHPVPPPPGMISDRAKTQLTYKPRRALMAYLKKQAGRDIPDNFGKVDAPLLYWASVDEYLAHKDNKAECYFLIGRNLEHAQRLLLADPIQIRRSGVGLAEVTTTFVWQELKDKPLSAAIMDLYVMPYLHLGDKRRENHLSKPHLLSSAVAAYTSCEFPDKLLLVSEEACRESGDQNSQDACRFSIAKALVALKKIDEAIAVLEQVTDPSLVNGAKGYIATIRKEHPGPAAP